MFGKSKWFYEIKIYYLASVGQLSGINAKTYGTQLTLSSGSVDALFFGLFGHNNQYVCPFFVPTSKYKRLMTSKRKSHIKINLNTGQNFATSL